MSDLCHLFLSPPLHSLFIYSPKNGEMSYCTAHTHTGTTEHSLSLSFFYLPKGPIEHIHSHMQSLFFYSLIDLCEGLLFSVCSDLFDNEHQWSRPDNDGSERHGRAGEEADERVYGLVQDTAEEDRAGEPKAAQL